MGFGSSVRGWVRPSRESAFRRRESAAALFSFQPLLNRCRRLPGMAARAALRPGARGLRHLRAPSRPRCASRAARPAPSAAASFGLDLDPAAAASATPIHTVLASELDGLASRLGAWLRPESARRGAACPRRVASSRAPCAPRALGRIDACHMAACMSRDDDTALQRARVRSRDTRAVTGPDVAAWARASAFKAEAGKTLLLPGPGGALAGVLFGLVRSANTALLSAPAHGMTRRPLAHP